VSTPYPVHCANRCRDGNGGVDDSEVGDGGVGDGGDRDGGVDSGGTDDGGSTSTGAPTGPLGEKPIT